MSPVPFASSIAPAKKLLQQLIRVTPREPNLTVGVDIGSSSVKVVALGPRKGGKSRPVVGQQMVPLEAGQDVDPSEAIKRAVGALPVPARSVALSVSGQWVIMRAVEMPTMKPAEMTQALPFEAQRYLPFNVQDVVIDGAVLGPAGPSKTWVLIVACKKELIDRRVDAVKRAGLEAVVIDVDALALANAFLASRNGRGDEATHALVNVGSQLTNLVILQGEIPYLVRDIPWGSEKFTRAIAEQAGLDPAAVQQELREGPPRPERREAMKAALEGLVAELQLSFDYFENRFGQPPAAILVSGGLSLSAAFLDAMKSHLAQATQTVNPWVPAQGLSAQFAVAYGLALRTDA